MTSRMPATARAVLLSVGPNHGIRKGEIAVDERGRIGRASAGKWRLVFRATFLYVFVNIARVVGVTPTAGMPLPLVLHGGSAMLTLMAGFGVLAPVSTLTPRRARQFGRDACLCMTLISPVS